MLGLIFLQQNTNLEFINASVGCAKRIITRIMFEYRAKPVQVAFVEPNDEKGISKIPPELPTEIENAAIFQSLSEFADNTRSLDGERHEVPLSYAIRVGLRLFDDYIETVPKSKVRIKDKFRDEIIIFTDFENGELTEKHQKYIDEYKERSIDLYFVSSVARVTPLHKDLTSTEIIEMVNDHQSLPEIITSFPHTSRFMKDVQAPILHVSIAADLFYIIRKCKPPQSWKVNLTVGSELIPVAGFRITHPYEPPKFRPLVKHDDGEIPAKVRRVHAVPSQSELKTKYQFGENSVHIAKSEIDAHKITTQKCLDILFLMNKSEVNPAYIVKEPITIIYPDASNKEGVTAFRYLYKSMLAKNAVGVVRRCYYKNTYPKLFALQPHLKNSFIIFQLPFEDDLVNPYPFFKSKTELWKSPDEFDGVLETLDGEDEVAMNNFLEALTIRESDNYQPINLRFNPKVDLLQEMVVKKALDSNMDTVEQQDLLNIDKFRAPIINERLTDELLSGVVRILSQNT